MIQIGLHGKKTPIQLNSKNTIEQCYRTLHNNENLIRIHKRNPKRIDIFVPILYKDTIFRRWELLSQLQSIGSKYTEMGRQIIQLTKERVESQNMKMVYADTDSFIVSKPEEKK